MSIKNYRVEKFKDITREHRSFDKNGKELVENKTIKDCFIVILENGDSFVATRQELEKMDIEVPAETITYESNTTQSLIESVKPIE